MYHSPLSLVKITTVLFSTPFRFKLSVKFPTPSSMIAAIAATYCRRESGIDANFASW
jgi:hypothetical protein